MDAPLAHKRAVCVWADGSMANIDTVPPLPSLAACCRVLATAIKSMKAIMEMTIIKKSVISSFKIHINFVLWLMVLMQMCPDCEELGGPGCQGAAVQVTLHHSVHSCLPGIEFELGTLSRICPSGG